MVGSINDRSPAEAPALRSSSVCGSQLKWGTTKEMIVWEGAGTFSIPTYLARPLTHPQRRFGHLHHCTSNHLHYCHHPHRPYHRQMDSSKRQLSLVLILTILCRPFFFCWWFCYALNIIHAALDVSDASYVSNSKDRSHRKQSPPETPVLKTGYFGVIFDPCFHFINFHFEDYYDYDYTLLWLYTIHYIDHKRHNGRPLTASAMKMWLVEKDIQNLDAPMRYLGGCGSNGIGNLYDNRISC